MNTICKMLMDQVNNINTPLEVLCAVRLDLKEWNREDEARYVELVINRRRHGGMFLEKTFSAVDDLRAFRLRKAEAGHDIKQTLHDFATLMAGLPWALVGGLALSLRSIPRDTQDIAVLFIGDIEGSLVDRLSTEFRRIRPHAFEHKRTGVEVEVLTPGFVPLSNAMFQDTVATAELFDNVPVADEYHLIGAKLARGKTQDIADIEVLLKNLAYSGRSWDFDYKRLGFSTEHITLLESIQHRVKEEI